MYARVTIGQSQAGKIDELIQIARDSILPAAKQQQGFKGLLFLTDQSSNKGLGITLWETEADMLAGEASGYYREQLAKIARVLTAPSVREAYEGCWRFCNEKNEPLIVSRVVHQRW